MAWVATGVTGASLLGGFLSANGAKSAAAKASDANMRNAQATNDFNQRMFDQSRGAPGADGFGHTFLPSYFGGNEQALGQQAYNNFQKLSTLGNGAYDQLNSYQGGLNGSLNSSLGAFNNRFNGQDLQQRIGFANPYFQSRLNQAGTYGQGMRDVAGANSSAINTGLAQLLGQLNAGRQQQGFLGGSTFDRNRALSATLGARQQAAIANAQANAGANNYMADANFANAGDLRGLQMADQDYRGRLDAFPGAMGALSSYFNAPAQSLSNSFNTAMQPLNYFRMQPQAFQAQGAPMQEPGINNMQVFGSMLSQGANAYGNYQMGQQLLNRFGGGPGPTPGGSVNPYALSTGGPYGGASSTLMSNPYNMGGATPFQMPADSSFGQGPFNYNFPPTR